MTDPYGESKEAKMDDIVSIIVTGEILIHDRIVENALRADGSYDFNFVFDQLREEIAGADIRMANTEVIIGGKELGISGYPRFNLPYELADTIAVQITASDMGVLLYTDFGFVKNGSFMQFRIS